MLEQQFPLQIVRIGKNLVVVLGLEDELLRLASNRASFLAADRVTDELIRLGKDRVSILSFVAADGINILQETTRRWTYAGVQTIYAVANGNYRHDTRRQTDASECQLNAVIRTSHTDIRVDVLR